VLSLINPALLALPVVDVDGTFYVQGGLFLIMVFLLNFLLFKPWLEVQARRQNSIEGALEKAERLSIEAEDIGKDYDGKLRATRDKAQELRSDSRKEGEGAMAAELAKARDDARASFDEAQTKLDEEAETARAALGPRVDELAKEITTKILGRSA
jgi:F-type H+-transporting ATPase subunit b